MRFTIVDHFTEIDYEYEWGTCELCTHIGPVEFPEFTIKWEDGTYEDIPLYYAAWGYVHIVAINNVFDFAGWLKEQPDSRFADFTPGHLDFNDMNLLAIDYAEYLYDQEEKEEKETT